MLRCVILLCLVLSCYARPSKDEIDIKNVITVPPNCPSGQELINGVCRDVWRSSQNTDASVDLEKPQCSPIEVRINGKCISTLRSAIKVPKETIVVPPNCPAGQELVNGQCRDIWKALAFVNQQNKDISAMNAVTVPTNCKPPYQWADGQCREIWRSSSRAENGEANEILLNQYQDLVLFADRIKRQSEEKKSNSFNKKVINVPNQCPNGYRPDSQGVCREIFE